MIGKLCNRIFSFITAHKQGYVFTPVCHSGCLPQCMLGYTPQEQTPLPWEADTPPLGSRHPLEADTPWKQTPPKEADTPPGSRHPWEADTPPGKQTHPQEADTPRSRHPLGKQTQPPPSAQCMLGDTGNKRVVRILLECILVRDKCESSIVHGKLRHLRATWKYIKFLFNCAGN